MTAEPAGRPTTTGPAGRPTTTTNLLGRLAAAPISWGVCEVPGWGHQMPAGRVLTEMRAVGLTACEFGPDGFLPTDPAARATLLAEHGLRPVGGFLPAVLHDPGHDPLPQIERALGEFADAGAGMLVLAASTGLAGYDGRPALGKPEWATLLANCDRVAGRAAEHRLAAALHPHVGTVVERAGEVRMVLERSMIGLCLDTGHLLIGGTDPVALAMQAPHRIAHVHLKDVDPGTAKQLRAGELSYPQAVRCGLYRPLGAGAVDIGGIVAALEGAGYRGWYVLEQDTVLDAEPPAGAGPITDVRASVDFLAAL